MKMAEANIETNNAVHFGEPFSVRPPRCSLLSKAAFAEAWNRAEGGTAWAHLQPGK